MAIRFVRVEQMFGLRGGLFDGEDADVWTAVGRAIDAEVPEAPDLDFKRVWWDKATEMAKDCAALANGLGGVIIVGVDDDHRDVAAAWSPVPLTRGLDLTLQQAVAANTAPKVPGILVRAVPDPADPARGVVIVGVPRSPVAPHAHPVNRERLGYPIRRSTSTDWLLEYEIADRYRSRFDLAHSQQDRADDVRRAALPALDRASWVWTTVALVPSATGSLPLSRAEVDAALGLVERWQTDMPTLDSQAILYSYSARVRRQRVVITSDPHQPMSQTEHHELWLDGSGSAATIVASTAGPESSQWSMVDQRRVEHAVLRLLDLLIHHAVRAGAAGDAVCIAALLPAWKDNALDEVVSTPDLSRVVLPERIGVPVIIGDVESLNPPADSLLMHARRRDTEPAQVTVPLDAAAADGRELAAAACGLALEMLAEDGVSEPDLLTISGELDVDAPRPARRQAFISWAQHRGIPVRPRGQHP